MRAMTARILLLALLPLATWAGDRPDTQVKLSSGGMERTYELHLPMPLPAEPLPLVVALHGGGGTGIGMAEMSGFDDFADHFGFIVVYPDGTDKPRPLREKLGKQGFLTWNSGGSCCGYAHDHKVDDVGFIRAVVVDVEKDHAVDPKRVFATGISNGGMMAYRLGCEASDIFAAIGPVSADQEITPCKPVQPVAVIHIHGAKDEYVPLLGGVGKKAHVKETRPPVQDSIDFWVKQDGCTVTAHSTQPDVLMSNYGGCADGTDVDYYVIQDGGHAWPSGKQMAFFLDKPSQALQGSLLIWDFFSKHPRR